MYYKLMFAFIDFFYDIILIFKRDMRIFESNIVHIVNNCLKTKMKKR